MTYFDHRDYKCREYTGASGRTIQIMEQGSWKSASFDRSDPRDGDADLDQFIDGLEQEKANALALQEAYD